MGDTRKAVWLDGPKITQERQQATKRSIQAVAWTSAMHSITMISHTHSRDVYKEVPVTIKSSTLAGKPASQQQSLTTETLA